MEKIKAIALMSGGLDSILAAKLIKDLGIEVIGLHLKSPFGGSSHVLKCAEQIGVPLIIEEKGEDYLDLLKHPHYGYGKNFNPCIDCRIAMFKLVEAVMAREGAHFVVSGEVLGQRPMSQRRFTMSLIDRKSETAGLVLRPLSAKLMKPTLAEEKGWVDREKLLAIKGRSRTEQYALAARWGITEFSSPGGGCLLTEKTFVPRIKDFFDHDPTRHRLGQSQLLRYGRHFRVSDNVKVILGRDERENNELSTRWKAAGGTYFCCESFMGPDAVLLGPLDENTLQLVGGMMAYYGKPDAGSEILVSVETVEEKNTFPVLGKLTESEISPMKIR